MKYRLGKKQNRVILDENGKEIAIFSPGQEHLAEQVVNYLNREEKAPCNHNWQKSHSSHMLYCGICGKYKPEGA